MAGYYNKDKIKEQLEIEQIFDLLVDLGGEPEYAPSGIISQTICHNKPGEGSYKLYYYANSQLFKCYTGCIDNNGSFDIFELVIKAKRIQKDVEWELYDAMVYVAQFFGLGESERPVEEDAAPHWVVFKRHEFSLPELQPKVTLKEFDINILERFAYPDIPSWQKEGISKETCKRNQIGYYAGSNQITIPHFDINNRLIGIRGRYLAEEDAERFGKYRPLMLNNVLYNHPLSMNLYNLNNSKENIQKRKVAIVFESEKATLAFQSYYGIENDISVACCGSNLSNYQVKLLEDLGVAEIIIAFDRDFIKIGDDEFKRLKNKLIAINHKYGNRIKITAIFDKQMLLPHKASPIDVSKEIFEKLLNSRIVPKE